MSVAPEIGTSCFTSAMDWMDTRSSARHSRTTPTPPRNPAIRHLRETASWGAATVPCFTARARAPLPRQPRTGEHRARKSRRATAVLYYTFCTAAADARARADTPASLRGVQSHSESDSNIERERSKERRKKESSAISSRNGERDGPSGGACPNRCGAVQRSVRQVRARLEGVFPHHHPQPLCRQTRLRPVPDARVQRPPAPPRPA